MADERARYYRRLRKLRGSARRWSVMGGGLTAAAAATDTDDLLRACYGSADFREGVRAFLGHRAPRWQGR